MREVTTAKFMMFLCPHRMELQNSAQSAASCPDGSVQHIRVKNVPQPDPDGI